MTERESLEQPDPSTSDETPRDVEEDVSFEAALDRLEQVVDRLEQGELELEVSLAAFEEGVRLSKHCAGQLAAAESRVEILIREGEDWMARPFEVTGEGEGDDSQDARGSHGEPEESD
jgi:exodeoxyribonuclease VII small subunit